MAPKSYKVSVPGSLMLMGEHAVLHDKSAMVMATGQRLHMTLTPNDTHFITIRDSRLGELQVPLHNITEQQPFTHVLKVLQQFKTFPSGFAVEIQSEFASNLGFGSSAAVTVATIAAVSSWMAPASNEQIFSLAQQLNVGGSGADMAASIYGGALHYSMQDQVIEQLQDIPALTAVYCGYKTPTHQVIAIVNHNKQLHKNLYAKVFDAMQECTQNAIIACKMRNWPVLGEIFTKHHYLQAALGVSNNLLDSIVQKLCAQQGMYGAKISGAGLGDCVVGIGELTDQIFSAPQCQFQVTVSERGLVYEYN